MRHNISFGMHTLHLWVAAYLYTIGLLTLFLLRSPEISCKAYFLTVGRSRWQRSHASRQVPKHLQDFILSAVSYHAFCFSSFRMNIVVYHVAVLFLLANAFAFQLDNLHGTFGYSVCVSVSCRSLRKDVHACT